MGWQDATVDTIKRLQAIIALAPNLSDEHRRGLYSEARLITEVLNPGTQRFWNIYLNVLRILVVGGETNTTPDKQELYGEAQKPDDDGTSCAATKPRARGKGIVHCRLNEYHKGSHIFEE